MFVETKTDGMSFPGFHPDIEVGMIPKCNMGARCKARVRTVPAESNDCKSSFVSPQWNITTRTPNLAYLHFTLFQLLELAFDDDAFTIKKKRDNSLSFHMKNI